MKRCLRSRIRPGKTQSDLLSLNLDFRDTERGVIRPRQQISSALIMHSVRYAPLLFAYGMPLFLIVRHNNIQNYKADIFRKRYTSRDTTNHEFGVTDLGRGCSKYR